MRYMQIQIETLHKGAPQLSKNEFLVATRVVRPDARRIPLHDVFDVPLWVGRAYCTDEEIKALYAARDKQMEQALDVVKGTGIVFTSTTQKLMKRALEPMLFLTDSDLLNAGNSTVIFRTGVRPTGQSVAMEGLMAFPVPHGGSLSQLVFYRPRSWSSAELPGYVRSGTDATTVMEVMGFQVGRSGLRGNGVKSLTFPKLRTSRVRHIR